MSPESYRAALAHLGFESFIDGGRWFGVNDRSARKFADLKGDGPPGSIEKLLRYMLATDQGPGAIDDAIRRGKQR